MDDQGWLAERFEANRSHLRRVAFRMLGSLTEADDAVQEAWIRLSRTDTSHVDNLRAFLTTVVGRVCLNMLRSRKTRREASLEIHLPDSMLSPVEGIDPEQEALLGDSVGLALLVVLDSLTPAERVAFVLHDVFAVPFDEIAPIVGRTTTAVRQLASRARRVRPPLGCPRPRGRAALGRRGGASGSDGAGPRRAGRCRTSDGLPSPRRDVDPHPRERYTRRGCLGARRESICARGPDGQGREDRGDQRAAAYQLQGSAR